MARLTLRLRQTRRTIGNLPQRASQATSPAGAGRGQPPAKARVLRGVCLDLFQSCRPCASRRWRTPFLRGPIFRAHRLAHPLPHRSQQASLYALRPGAAERGLPFALLPAFPGNSVPAAPLTGWVAGDIPAQCAEPAAIADASVLGRILGQLGLDQAQLLASIER